MHVQLSGNGYYPAKLKLLGSGGVTERLWGTDAMW